MKLNKVSSDDDDDGSDDGDNDDGDKYGHSDYDIRHS